MDKIVIIGSGPAGLTAAIYCARANLKPVLFSGITKGGQLTITTEIENFPGFPEGISGPELMNRMFEQAKRFNTNILEENVISVDFKNRPFLIKGENSEIETLSVIIATGAYAKYLGVKGEKKYMGKGISACATCDGFFYRNKEVLVIGGGDTAIEEATFLTNFASKVVLVHRRDTLRASKIMQDKAFANKKISFIWNSVLEEVCGTDVVTGAILKALPTGDLSEIKCDGIFIAIGHNPNTEIFKGQLSLNENGYISSKSNVETEIPGIFVAGDVADEKYRQAITAAGMGCMAAITAERYLQEN